VSSHPGDGFLPEALKAVAFFFSILFIHLFLKPINKKESKRT
jgi:hypothetical protein